LRIGAALLALFSFCSPGTADWQYTKWGMTVDQAAAASKGQMKQCAPTTCAGQNTELHDARLYGHYASGDFRFAGYLLFDKKSQKLALVNLKLANQTQSSDLIGGLRARYGEPASQSKSAIMEIWTWRTPTDQINLLVIGDARSGSTTLSYKPRITDNTKGL
jgi:hypothetical protein